MVLPVFYLLLMLCHTYLKTKVRAGVRGQEMERPVHIDTGTPYEGDIFKYLTGSAS